MPSTATIVLMLSAIAFWTSIGRSPRGVSPSLAPPAARGLDPPPVYPPPRRTSPDQAEEHAYPMAKRTRYPGRPAGRRPTAKPGPTASVTSTSSVRTGGLTPAELERAAVLEAELVAHEKAAAVESSKRRIRGRSVDVAVRVNSAEPLSVRASHEYAYVARDVRRIGLTAGLMFAILAAIWVLVNVGGVGLP